MCFLNYYILIIIKQCIMLFCPLIHTKHINIFIPFLMEKTRSRASFKYMALKCYNLLPPEQIRSVLLTKDLKNLIQFYCGFFNFSLFADYSWICLIVFAYSFVKIFHHADCSFCTFSYQRKFFPNSSWTDCFIDICQVGNY